MPPRLASRLGAAPLWASEGRNGRNTVQREGNADDCIRGRAGSEDGYIIASIALSLPTSPLKEAQWPACRNADSDADSGDADSDIDSDADTSSSES
eukprot:764117-Hanusia_phi.AAC.2